MKYAPLFISLFKKYAYSWEDLDLKIYKKILKEEGYSKKEIDQEIHYLNQNDDLMSASYFA